MTKEIVIENRHLLIRAMRSHYGFSTFEATAAIEAFTLFKAIESLTTDEALKNILWRLSPKLRPEIRDFIEQYISEQSNDQDYQNCK